MTRIKNNFWLLLLLFTLASGYCRAQQTDSVFYHPHKTYFWGGIDAGTGTFPLTIGGSGYALFNNKFLLGFKAAANVNLILNQDNEVDEFALMGGFKLTHHPYGNLMLLTGISLVSVSVPDPSYYSSKDIFYTFGTGNNLHYATVGLPIALKYLFSPSEHFGFGVAASANINDKRNLFNVTINTSFGMLRSGGRARRAHR